jgi:hypothetical protein
MPVQPSSSPAVAATYGENPVDKINRHRARTALPNFQKIPMKAKKPSGRQPLPDLHEIPVRPFRPA